MKKILFYAFTLLAGLIIFILVIKKVGTQEIIKAIDFFDWWKWLVILLVGLASFFIGVWRWKYIIKVLTGKNIGLKLATTAKTIGWTIAYITPIAYIGGEPHKVYLLKEEGGINWETAGASVIIDEVLDLSVSLLFLLLGAIFLIIKFSVPKILILFLAGGLTTCLVLWLIFWRQTKNGRGFISFFIQLFGLNRLKWVNNIQGRIETAEQETAGFFRYHRLSFFYALLLAFLERLTLIAAFWLIVEFLGHQINLFQVMSIMALSVAVYFLPLPASLGGQEASQVIIFNLFGLGAGTGLAFSLIIRILSLGAVLAGLFFLLGFEFKIFKQKIIAFGSRFEKLFR